MIFNKRPSLYIILGVILLALALAGCDPSYCDSTFVVTKFTDTNDGACDGDCSLREAVIGSNVCSGTQTIQLPAGIYDLSIAGTGEDLAATGDLDVTEDAIIIGVGAPFIDANSIDRVFEIHSGATVEIHTMLIRGGEEQVGAGIRNHGSLTMYGGVVAENIGFFPEGIMGGSSGGGIWSDGTLVLEGTQVRQNSADMGGGIKISGSGTLNMSGGSPMIHDNIAHITGGGLAVAYGAEATLTGVDIWRNEAGEDGGGIFNGGTVHLNQSIVHENSSGYIAGGIVNYYGATTWATETRFEDNDADQGGAIFTSGLVTLYKSSITNNSATNGAGGGAYVEAAFPGLHLKNTTVSNNTASLAGSGGGIHNDAGDVWLEWVTVAENGPLGFVNTPGSHVMIENSIVAYNISGNCTGIGLGSGGYNIEDGTSCNFTDVDDMSSTDPLLGPLANNGGLTLTHALLSGSPAIDTAVIETCTANDQRGVSRPQGPRCDRGAYEKDVLIPAIELTPITAVPPVIPPTETPTPLPPISINFNADSYSIKQGKCTTLRWAVENAEDVFLDGELVEILDARQVCPNKTTKYTLLAMSGNQEEEAFVTIEVEILPEPPEAPARLSFERVCNAKIYRITLTWLDRADNETGYRVYRDGVLITTLSENAISYVDNPPFGGPYTYAVEAFNEGGASSQATVKPEKCNTRQ